MKNKIINKIDSLIENGIIKFNGRFYKTKYNIKQYIYDSLENEKININKYKEKSNTFWNNKEFIINDSYNWYKNLTNEKTKNNIVIKQTFKKGEKFTYIIPWVNGEEVENTRTFNKTTHIYSVTDHTITKGDKKIVFGKECFYKFLGYNKENKNIRYYYLEK